MASFRLSLLFGFISLGILVSCNTTKSTSSEQKPSGQKPNNQKQTQVAVMESSANEEKIETIKQKPKESKSNSSKIEMVSLPPEIENKFPNEAMTEKGDRPKQVAVTRDHANAAKVLEILIPDKKNVEEDKFIANVKKGQSPSFTPCSNFDLPIIRLTNTRFIDEKYPTISTNGDFLVYEGWHRPESGEATAQALYCIKLDETLRRTVLVKNGFNTVRPFFHPNLTEVYFSTDSFRNEFHVSSISLDGSAAANLNFRKYCRDVLDVSISLNSDYAISYFKEGKLTPSIGMVSRTGIFLPEITEGREVSWSQSGERLAFINYNGNYLDVYTAKSDGSDLQQITTHFGICHHPSFSPDDNWVVFSAVVEGSKKHNLFLVSKDGKNLLQVTNAAENDKNPFWGKDGWIYFETERFEGNTEIAKIDGAQFIKKFEEQKKPPVFIK